MVIYRIKNLFYVVTHKRHNPVSGDLFGTFKNIKTDIEVLATKDGRGNMIDMRTGKMLDCAEWRYTRVDTIRELAEIELRKRLSKYGRV